MFLTISLAACGGSKTADVPAGNQNIQTARVVTAKAVLARMDTARYKEGELLVKFKSGVVSKVLMKTHEGTGAKVLKSYDIVPNLQHVKLDAGTSVRNAVETYMADPNVEYAEPNYVRCAASVTPNDTYFTPQQWALFNTGTFANGTPGADIRARDAWDLTKGDRKVVIAVIDSGIDYSHPDLVNNVWTNAGESSPVSRRANGVDDDNNGFIDDWRGWNFTDNNNDPFDDLGHGTHVSGIIGAAGNNNIGVAGVMWNVRIMPLKIFNATTTTDSLCGVAGGFVADEIAAIQYAWRNGANIINASYGNVLQFCQVEFDAIAVAEQHGLLFVVAAGDSTRNVDLDIGQPEINDLHNIIAVAATDQNDRLATFSDYGPNSVHLAAPGVYILSTVPTGFVTESTKIIMSGASSYAFLDGTSMAAPHVAGVAGLIYSYYNKDVNHFDYRQVRGMILRYVDTVADSPNLTLLTGRVFSNGRLNAYKALSSLLQPTELAAISTGTTEITLTWKDNAKGEDLYVIERRPSNSNSVFVVIKDNVPLNSTQFVDKGLTPGVGFEYRVKAMAYLPNPPGAGLITADSFYSNSASVTTPLTAPVVPESGGGGGGCSIGTRQNSPTAASDTVALLLPLIVLGLIRAIRRKR